MRGAPWLAGFACVALVLVPTALFADAQDPQPRDGTTLRPSGPDLHHFAGTSALHLKGACLDDDTCVGDKTREDGAFFLPTLGRDGRVVVTWDAVNDSLRTLRVQVAGHEQMGQSPLVFAFPGLDPGAHAVRVEPTGRVAGAYDQRVDWVGTFALDAAFAYLDRQGRSTFEPSACVLGTCAPTTREHADTIIAPWAARGSLTADWDPRDGPIRLTLRGTGFVAEGEPPLTLPLDGLTAGEWSVDVRPASEPYLPIDGLDVFWQVRLAQAP